ncbi:MAG: metallophosphoesterase [Streptosporangiales bacterium]
MVRVLAVSDVVDEALWADVSPVRSAELIVGCGDLPFEYLGRLMNALDVPLVFVPGNHDPDVSGYRASRGGLWLRAGLPARPPWPDGAVNADGLIVDIAGLRIAGLGGCRRYSDGPNQYTDGQQRRRAARLAARARLHRLRNGPLPAAAARPGRAAAGEPARRPRHPLADVLLTHSPPRGVGDGPDRPHQGFASLGTLAAQLSPALLAHGHTDPGPGGRAGQFLGSTLVFNVTGHHLLDIEPGGGPGRLAGASASRPAAGSPGPVDRMGPGRPGVRHAG